MAVPTEVWRSIGPASAPWKPAGLDYLRQHLGPNVHSVWSNFEFISLEGHLYDVDALVLTARGLYLIEMQNHTGVLQGDRETWVHEKAAGTRPTPQDSPLRLVESKARALFRLLKSSVASIPVVEPVIFMANDVELKLVGLDKMPVFKKEELLSALAPLGRLSQGGQDVDPGLRQSIVTAMEKIALRVPERARQVGPIFLGPLIADGAGFQDRLGRQAPNSPEVRVRLYPAPRATSPEQRDAVVRVAEKDYKRVAKVKHGGILRPTNLYKENLLGPAMVFEHPATALRLDHYIGLHSRRLDWPTRIGLIRQLAEALDTANVDGVVHGSFSPQSVLVFEPDSATPVLKITDWVAPQEGRGLMAGPLAAVYVAPEVWASPGEVEEQADVYSIGAVSHFILTGRAPARSLEELDATLRRQNGLKPRVVNPAVPASLDDLVYKATRIATDDRISDMGEFMVLLDEAEEKLDEPSVLDAGALVPGEKLGQFVIQQKLDETDQYVCYSVAWDRGSAVLKLPRKASEGEWLAAEVARLQRLNVPNKVQVLQVVELEGHPGVLLDRWADQRLSVRLQKEGPLPGETVKQLGTELLETGLELVAAGVSLAPGVTDRLGLVEGGLLVLSLEDAEVQDEVSFALADALFAMATAAVDEELDPDRVQETLGLAGVSFFQRLFAEPFPTVQEMLDAWIYTVVV